MAFYESNLSYLLLPDEVLTGGGLNRKYAYEKPTPEQLAFVPGKWDRVLLVYRCSVRGTTVSYRAYRNRETGNYIHVTSQYRLIHLWGLNKEGQVYDLLQPTATWDAEHIKSTYAGPKPGEYMMSHFC